MVESSSTRTAKRKASMPDVNYVHHEQVKEDYSGQPEPDIAGDTNTPESSLKENVETIILRSRIAVVHNTCTSQCAVAAILLTIRDRNGSHDPYTAMCNGDDPPCDQGSQ